MTELTFTLISDGPSDKMLLPILRWLLVQHRPEWAVQDRWADTRHLRNPPKTLAGRVCEGLRLYPCDLLFIHRDAENQGPSRRKTEVEDAVRHLRSRNVEPPPAICVVPVRMTEAWLLLDETAIRQAAGNPNGTAPLDLPALRQLELLADPKSVLTNALKQASGLSGRRLKTFQKRMAFCVQRIAELSEDFSRLRELPAFQMLERDLRECLARQWPIT